MRRHASATDPLWYKDAVIYELHVRSFADSNNDGIGDFQGLISRLDYLQDLGVTCIWLLPFFPSPLRDDGYDIANYVDVNPHYGTLADFKEFLRVAHTRNMQVMIELVINHTSDQHPWFQAARVAPADSEEREMYVWSPTDQLYKDARIIFTDTETSNWTWDERAGAYYWHRFFSHQPDLNFGSPRVMEQVLNAMRFWLDLGVDALRMDAIPYLVEKDGTNCENLPETHAAIKQIRATIDVEYANRLILAEANQWPVDVRPYFGDGDECHMAFHFPLMPRIYMALRQEDRLPIVDIMAQTPDIPTNCQWGLFLRNHDELTLEMVTDDERDYMYIAYSSDPRMRVNVGIRRRLAPLVDNNRRRIELLNSLLLSFPGTPILYYGDEIGMGDNIYLGDRNGVRTPMQWNADRNAGFSKCDPARLYLPVVMDPIYGFQTVNVEMQLSDQSSLLHWTRNMIALRKLFRVFGRGTLRFLLPENRTILAYIRHLSDELRGDQTVLCVANLSRFAQPVELDLAPYAGATPVEMLGYVTFPTVTKAPYRLTLAPYSFFWFELQEMSGVANNSEMHHEASRTLETVGDAIERKGWSALTHGEGLDLLQSLLPAWLMRQRWFSGRGHTVATLHIAGYAKVPHMGARSDERAAELATPDMIGNAIFFIDVSYDDSASETYQIPLSIGTGPHLDLILANAKESVIADVTLKSGPAILYESFASEDFRASLLAMIQRERAIPLEPAISPVPVETGQHISEVGQFIGLRLADVELSGVRSCENSEADFSHALSSRIGSVEQSNTSVLFAQSSILKFFRKLHLGKNSDLEVGEYLANSGRFPHTAPLLGSLSLKGSDGQEITCGMLQEFIANEGDGWKWALDELDQFLRVSALLPGPNDLGGRASFSTPGRVSADVLNIAGDYIDAISLLGQRTAEMHMALATPIEDPAFIPEIIVPGDMDIQSTEMQAQASEVFTALTATIPNLDQAAVTQANAVLNLKETILSQLGTVKTLTSSGLRIRIHGDYHLGQILRSNGDFIVLDFEGEPAKPLLERRRKQSPLRDVAGMLRSFSYAAWTGVEQYTQANPDKRARASSWSSVWERSTCIAFLNAYRKTITKRSDLLPQPSDSDTLLAAYIVDKSLYEIGYELRYRPSWVRVPFAGLLEQLDISKEPAI